MKEARWRWSCPVDVGLFEHKYITMQKGAVLVLTVLLLFFLTGHVSRADDTKATTAKPPQTTTLDLIKFLEALFGTTKSPPATTAKPAATTTKATTTTTTTTTTTQSPFMQFLRTLTFLRWFGFMD